MVMKLMVQYYWRVHWLFWVITCHFIEKCCCRRNIGISCCCITFGNIWLSWNDCSHPTGIPRHFSMPGYWQRVVIVSCILKCITLAFLLLSGQHQLLQNLWTGISQQLNFSLFLLLMIITSVRFTICRRSVIHFFALPSLHHPSPNHTLLPHPNLAFKLTTPTNYITTSTTTTTISTCAIPPP